MIPGTKPLAYYKDQYGIHPIWGWQKIANPPIGWLAVKTDGWTADQFDPGGLEVDFSNHVPIGTKAVRIRLAQTGTQSGVFYRKSGDGNISNTPQAGYEYSHGLMYDEDDTAQVVVWLSSDYKVEFSVNDILTNLYVSTPVEYLI